MNVCIYIYIYIYIYKYSHKHRFSLEINEMTFEKPMAYQKLDFISLAMDSKGFKLYLIILQKWNNLF